MAATDRSASSCVIKPPCVTVRYSTVAQILPLREGDLSQDPKGARSLAGCRSIGPRGGRKGARGVAQVKRWLEITASPFAHEAEGLSRIKALLPDQPPF